MKTHFVSRLSGCFGPRQEREGRHPAKAVVRPLLVVDPQPCHGQRLQLGDRLKEMGVEHLRAIAPVEPLDVGILVGLARLDVVDRHPVVGAPVDERLREKFRPVVQDM